MNANAKNWVEALESGRFNQGRGMLTRRDPTGCQEDRHCCLGVACVLYQEEVGDLELFREGELVSYDGDDGILPPKVCRWLGLRNRQGAYGADEALTDLNDHGASFVDIARVIRREPEGLFST